LRKESVTILFILLSSVIFLGGLSSLGHAQNDAKVAVDPSSVANLGDTSGSVTFRVNLTDSPSIDGFQVSLAYNASVLHATSLSYAGNVLGSGAQILIDCIDGIAQPGSSQCLITDSIGVVTLALYTLGSGTTVSPTNGALFSVSFSIVGLGLSQLHLFGVQLINGVTLTNIPTANFDGYFTNSDCPRGSGVLCSPPIADFTVSPSKLFAKAPVIFNASTSIATNAGAGIRLYLWVWLAGDPIGTSSNSLETSNQITSHIFLLPGNFSVTLTVTDSFGSAASKTITVTVIEPPDFTIESKSSHLIEVIAGRATSREILVSSMAGFSGSINFTLDVSLHNVSPNVTISLSVSQSAVRSGGTNSTLLLVSADKNSVEGAADALVTGKSGSLSHSISFLVYVIRPTVSFSCDPISDAFCGLFFVSPGGSISLPIFLFGYFGFQGTVNLQPISSTFVSIVWSQPTVALDTNGTNTVRVTILTKPQIPLGFTSISLGGTSPNGSIDFVRLGLFIGNPPLPPDISNVAPSSIRLRAGQNTTFQASIRSLNGFAGQVDFGAGAFPFSSASNLQVYPPSGFVSFINLAANQTVSINLVLSANALTAPGNYTVVTYAFASVGVPGSPFCCPTDRITTTIVTVLPPVDPPIFVQFHWKHVLSYPEQATSTGQDFTWGIYNPNNSTTLYLDVSITGFSQTGDEAFNVDSGLVSLLPGQTITNLHLVQTFGPSEIGAKFYFDTIIRWGVSQDKLNFSNSSTETPISGSFTFKPM
jgi:PKD repeat protein